MIHAIQDREIKETIQDRRIKEFSFLAHRTSKKQSRPLRNVRRIQFSDGSEEVIVSDRPVMSCPREEETRFVLPPAGCEVIRKDSDKITPFGEEALYLVVNHDLFSRAEEITQDLEPSEEVKALRKERSEKESIRRAKREVEIIGRCNDWTGGYFLTLTFDDELVNALDYDACYSAVEKWLDCMRKRYASMQYILVFEKHPSSGRYHVHGLLRGCSLRLLPAQNPHTGKLIFKNGKQIFNLDSKEYKYGFTTVSRVADSGAAAMYISKYIGKALGEVPSGCHRYLASRTLQRLKDVAQDFLYETAGELELVKETLLGLADRVNSVFVKITGTTFTYYKMFAAPPQCLDCPT